MTADEFERAYAARSHITLDELRVYRSVRPCDCGEAGCEGWQSISHERAAEYDAHAGKQEIGTDDAKQ